MIGEKPMLDAEQHETYLKSLSFAQLCAGKFGSALFRYLLQNDAQCPGKWKKNE